MSSILSEHGKFIENGGVFIFEKGVLKITGPDASDFLHRVTSQNIRSLTPGSGIPAALLQPNAAIISFFNLYNSGHFFLIVVDKDQLSKTAEQLEKLHFAEDLQITDVSSDFGFLSVQGSKVPGGLKTLGYKVPGKTHEILGSEECFIMNEPDFGENGYHLLVKAAHLEAVKAKLSSQGLPLLGRDLWSLLRVEAGYFTFGVDITEKNLILEASLADFVSRDKGCYPGQEVVERVFTYGNVAKKLVGIEISGTLQKSPSAPKLFAEGKETGTVTSFQVIPWSHKCLGFAIVRKPHYNAGEMLMLEPGNISAKVVELPQTFKIHREPA